MAHMALFILVILLVAAKDSAFSIPSHGSHFRTRVKMTSSLPTAQLVGENRVYTDPKVASLPYWDFDVVNAVEIGVATSYLVGANLITFFLQLIIPNITQRLLKNDYLIARGQVFRLFTSTFLHSNLRHLMANSMSLINCGTEAEKLLGSRRFALIYLVSGIIGNLITFAVGTSPSSLGASGCVFGVLGALASFYHRNRHRIRSWEHIMQYFARVLLVEVGALFQMRSRIDHLGHIGGFIGGVLCEMISFYFLQQRRAPSDMVGRINQLVQSLNPFRRPIEPSYTYVWRL